MRFCGQLVRFRRTAVLDTWTTAHAMKCRSVKWHAVICRCG